MNRRQFRALGRDFSIDDRYELVKEIGSGSYGSVIAVQEVQEPKQKLAIKQINNIFTKKILTKRALREIKLLRFFRGHKNIIFLTALDIVDVFSFNEVYVYAELMEADLHAIIRSKQPLTDAHYQSFTYQILCALKFIHSANVIHRDLKPGNLLVNADCKLKICDLGLARGFDASKASDSSLAGGFMTEYVATRWYRSPEIMLSFANYGPALDLWSVGCILAELLGGVPIFKGSDYVDQLNQILNVLGTPNDETLKNVGTPRAQEYIRHLPYSAPKDLSKQFPHSNPLAIDLLTKLLQFDPSQRIDCDQALLHPYLETWHDPADEPVSSQKFDFAFDDVENQDVMRQMLIDEVQAFKTEMRAEPEGGPQSLLLPITDIPKQEQDEAKSPYASPHPDEPFKDLAEELERMAAS